LLSGLTAALVLTLLQRWLMLPVLVEVDNYLYAARQPDLFNITHTIGRDRSLMLALTNIALGAGYALLLVAAMSLRGTSGVWQGMLWGMAGWITFAALPTLTLGVDLSGLASTNDWQRQGWWATSASLAAVGLASMAYARTRWACLSGLLLVLLPLGIGAPARIEESIIPDQLAQTFHGLRLATLLIFWLVTGITAGLLLKPDTKQ